MDYNIYVKFTNKCNLNCKHCYNEIMKNYSSMSDDTLNKTITWIKNFRNNHQSDDINISLHGGEPLLYNLDNVLYFIKSLKNEKLNWCITTNLMYDISEKHEEIFNYMKPFNNECMIMTSYDYGNIRFNNQENVDRWIKNVKYLKSKGIEVQPIICLTKYLIENIIPEEVYGFISSLRLKYFNFERITETGNAVYNNIKPKNKDVDEWLYNFYLIYKNSDLICPLFESIEKSINGILLGCRERKCMEKVITINPDGSIGGCPNQANRTYTDLDGNSSKYNYNDLICEERKIDSRCYICNYFRYCNGDCFQLKWDDDICPAPRKIYEYLLKNNF